MDREHFQEVRQDFRRRGLLTAGNRLGALTVLFELMLTALLVAGLVEAPGWWKAPIEILFGLVLFCWFVILHESGHRTLFRSRLANTLTGLLASAFCLVPYFAWRNVHQQHHRWAGIVDRDPTQSYLLTLRHAGQGGNIFFRIVWFLWLPFPFFRFIFSSFWLYAWDQYRAGNLRNAGLGLVSDLVCAIPQWVLLAWLGPVSWGMHVLPVFVVYLFIIENLSLPQHTELVPYLSAGHPDPIPCSQQDLVTRSTFLPDWVSLLVLNFNRHTEHHMFPTAPWFALGRIRSRLVRSGYRHPFEVAFGLFMMRLRLRDPVSIYRDSLPEWDPPSL
jgi:omega-6 fatty acid desaturase (delta-12 desaturase)